MPKTKQKFSFLSKIPWWNGTAELMKGAPAPWHLAKVHVLEGFSPLWLPQMFYQVTLLKWWKGLDSVTALKSLHRWKAEVWVIQLLWQAQRARSSLNQTFIMVTPHSCEQTTGKYDPSSLCSCKRLFPVLPKGKMVFAWEVFGVLAKKMLLFLCTTFSLWQRWHKKKFPKVSF